MLWGACYIYRRFHCTQELTTLPPFQQRLTLSHTAIDKPDSQQCAPFVISHNEWRVTHESAIPHNSLNIPPILRVTQTSEEVLVLIIHHHRRRETVGQVVDRGRFDRVIDFEVARIGPGDVFFSDVGEEGERGGGDCVPDCRWLS